MSIVLAHTPSLGIVLFLTVGQERINCHFTGKFHALINSKWFPGNIMLQLEVPWSTSMGYLATVAYDIYHIVCLGTVQNFS